MFPAAQFIINGPFINGHHGPHPMQTSTHVFWKEEGFAGSGGCFGILGPCDLRSPDDSTQDPVRTSCLWIRILSSLEASERGHGPRQSE